MALPESVSETSVALDGGRVRVLRSGELDRPVLLLLHGGGADNSEISWGRLITPLAEHWQAVAIDLPGFGGTLGIDPVGGPADLARFVIAVLDRLEIQDVICVGVSMGGDVALNLALVAPGRVRGLVLIAPGGLIPVFRNRAIHFLAWVGARLPDPVLLPLTRLANRYTEQALQAVVRHSERLPDDLVAEFVRESNRPLGGVAYLRYNQSSISWNRMTNNLLPVVANITAPTLIIHGEQDPLVDPEGSVRAAELMPHARLIMIEDCGHWVQVEEPNQFLDAVLPWLESSNAP